MGFKLTKEEYAGLKVIQERTGHSIKKILMKALENISSDSEISFKKKTIVNLFRKTNCLELKSKNGGQPNYEPLS